MLTWEKMSEIQPVACKIFTNSIRANRMSHAYILHGMSGSGKSELTELLAMSLFCEETNGVEPCQECHGCKRVISGNHPDIHRLKRETQTIRTEEVRDIIREFSMTGYESNQKMFIIPDAELLNIHAANRLLKFIEEPNEGTMIILSTNNVNALLPTIQSRCQIIDLLPLDNNQLKQKLVQAEISENDAQLISALTNNLDEGMALHEEKKIYKIRDLMKDLIEVVMKQNDERFLFLHLDILTELKEKAELEMALDIMFLAVQDMANLQMQRHHPPHVFIENDVLVEQAINYFSTKKLIKMMTSLLEAKRKLNQNIQSTLVMEDLVLQL